MNDPWICTECGHRSDGSPCPNHPDEVLLDVRDGDVQLMLQDIDDQGRRRRHYRLGIIALVVTCPLMILVPWGGLEIMAVWVVAAFALSGVLFKVFPYSARFAELTGQ